ncbi:DUF2214 domain-containing protein [Teredinibacter waterburyi]|uniref:DUF2214 domain-containing protein n=1 Tax=Teredinibacter waterburyi TaxID=1500538 RepID=UPI00165FBCDC|nr:DUF2214 domain-containing protein [Teredinibacter waterburyi]
MKTLLVYGHLISACIAVGAILMQDLELWTHKKKALTKNVLLQLAQAQTTVTWTLVFLWITGLALVALGYINQPEVYLTNQKLWVKFAVVIALTINGFVLHHYSLPKLKEGVVIAAMPARDSIPLTLTGAISIVSWLYACFLGIARPWNYTLDFGSIFGVYLAILIVSCIVGLQIMKLGRSVTLDSPTNA